MISEQQKYHRKHHIFSKCNYSNHGDSASALLLPVTLTWKQFQIHANRKRFNLFTEQTGEETTVHVHVSVCVSVFVWVCYLNVYVYMGLCVLVFVHQSVWYVYISVSVRYSVCVGNICVHERACVCVCTCVCYCTSVTLCMCVCI